MKSRIFLVFLASFILGVFLASIFQIKSQFLFYSLFLNIFFFSFLWRIGFLRYLLFSFLFVSLGFYHYYYFEQASAQTEIQKYYEKEASVLGFIDSDVSYGTTKSFYFKVKKINGEMLKKPAKLMVYLNLYEEAEFGQAYLLKGDIKEPSQEEFDFKGYLKSKGAFGTVSFPVLKKADFELGSGERFWLQVKDNLYNIKGYFSQIVQKIYPEPNASLMLGLLFGVKSSMPESLKSAFSATGLSHIVALSGFNITIIISLLKNLTQPLSRKLRFWLPVLGILLFVIMAGAEASIVRAGIMGLMLILAGKIGRQSDASVAIFFTAFLMIFLNPYILRFDVGFQLSFAALLGIIYLYPIFERLMAKVPQVVRENLGLTLSAQLFALPILVYNFGSLSIISPLANLLVLPAVPFTMLFGSISAGFGAISLSLGELFGWIGFLLTEMIIRISLFLAGFSQATIELDLKNPLFIVFYYLVLIDFILIIKRKKLINA